VTHPDIHAIEALQDAEKQAILARIRAEVHQVLRACRLADPAKTSVRVFAAWKSVGLVFPYPTRVRPGRPFERTWSNDHETRVYEETCPTSQVNGRSVSPRLEYVGSGDAVASDLGNRSVVLFSTAGAATP
jgi:hypothetical protein